jgi:HlyD family secretion protein
MHIRKQRRKRAIVVNWLALALAAAVWGCTREEAAGPPRASGFVEATEVRVSAKLPGQVETVGPTEGTRVEAGATLATMSTADLELALQRARAERGQADAQWRLFQAGARPEEIQQAEAQVAAATGDLAAAEAELTAAAQDAERFEQLLRNRAGSQKQRDDAVARRELAAARTRAAADRVNAARATLARLRAGSRPQEIAGARARVEAVEAQIAALEHDRREAVITAPIAGVVTSRLIEPGERVAAGQPLLVLMDLDRAWANAYVEAPLVQDLRLDAAAVVITDGGTRLDGRITFIASEPEFTPRNVQTAAERAKLVYRVKVAVDNRQGVLKPGMPVDVEFPAPAGPRGEP